jgi:hypothetical protein
VLVVRQPSRCVQRHAFCPVCGPRPATEKLLEAIEAARGALAIEDRFDYDERENLWAAGVFGRFAVDAIESVVSLFEQFAREQFFERVDDADTHTKNKGNIFQRLDDTATLFGDHADIDLPSLVGTDRWERLKRAFAQRHVLVHNGGVVDERFLNQVSARRSGWANVSSSVAPTARARSTISMRSSGRSRRPSPGVTARCGKAGEPLAGAIRPPC